MNLLFLDFETQTDDPATTNPTEVGATQVIVDEEGGKYAADRVMSQLVYEPRYPAQTPEIVEITHITDEMLKKDGLHPHTVWDIMLHPFISDADYVLCHNRSFDQMVYESTCKRLEIEPAKPKGGWICTVMDVPWKKSLKCKKLSHLAYDHGILVPPDTLHRAGADTDLLARLIMEHYKIEDIIKYWQTPWVYVVAKIPGPWVGNGGDGGIGVAQARKLQFSWEKPWGDERVFPKKWVKRIKETDVEALRGSAPFPIAVLEAK